VPHLCVHALASASQVKPAHACVIAASVFRHAYLSTEVNAGQKRIVLRSLYGTYAQLTGFSYPFSYWLLQTQELSLASVCLRSFP
jgi:hypothetical protein